MTSNNRAKSAGNLQERVARDLRNDIEAGILRDGESLPSTRALAEKWGVSIFTVNEAMKLLVAEGLVESQSRSRRIVRSSVKAPGRRLTTEPQAFLIGGYAGSGKTELGRILARLTRWPILDKDTTTRPVVETALEVRGLPPFDRESETYLSAIRPREYEALLETALENAECGVSTFVTAPFLREFRDRAWIERTRTQFRACGVNLSLVWVDCDGPTMQTYLRRRGAARDSAKLADWDAYLASIDLDFRPPVDHAVIYNSTSSEPLQVQAQQLLAGVSERTLA